MVENPTWMQLAKLANDMIQVTGDEHHVFLEGVEKTSEKDGIKNLLFIMGS